MLLVSFHDGDCWGYINMERQSQCVDQWERKRLQNSAYKPCLQSHHSGRWGNRFLIRHVSNALLPRGKYPMAEQMSRKNGQLKAIRVAKMTPTKHSAGPSVIQLIFVLLDPDFFAGEWPMVPVIRSNSQTPCSVAHMTSHIKKKKNLLNKKKMKEKLTSTLFDFVGPWCNFQK